MMIARPNYLDVTSVSGELVPHMERLQLDGEIDAIVVRGAQERLTAEQLQLLFVDVESNAPRTYGEKILRMVVPDLDEVRAFHKEMGNNVMPDFSVVDDSDILFLDMAREPGQKSYAHIDLPYGTWREGYDVIRGVNSVSVGCGTDSALFLVKRLHTFARDGDIGHEFTMDYLTTTLVDEIENGGHIKQDGWAIEQFPGDIVIFPQFDRPTVHQVNPKPARSALVFSTFLRSYYDAYRQSPDAYEIGDIRASTPTSHS